MAKIEPTVGRVVWYWPAGAYESNEQPRKADIAAVVDYGRAINIGYLDHEGCHHNAVGVLLWDGEGMRPHDAHCEWMPYQKGQAAKTEALEQKLAGS